MAWSQGINGWNTMLDSSRDRSNPSTPKPVIVFGVLAFVLALRLAHLSSALHSPLSFQPGPDEDYYRRFGEAVAANRGQDAAEFTFMDPAYGYLLGAVFRLIGVNSAAVYLLQALLDTATAYGILTIGRMLGRPRAGLYGALFYGATATAIMFCATLLKEVCVASFLTWWVVGALALYRSDRKLPWIFFGMFCGIGIALRSTLVLVAFFAACLPLQSSRKGWVLKTVLVIAGTTLSLIPWSVRNYEAYGSVSPLPHNGGIVLDQVYNAQNPQSAIWIPAFVNYSHPSEIWRGYAAEAQHVAGGTLSPPEVDRYWRGQALAFMREHPSQVLRDVARKGVIFLADSEIPNNRSSAEERLFSPILQLLPPPAPWLLAMGFAGLAWLAIGDRRWIVIAAPIAIAWFTVAVFWAEDRFRFHAGPMFAVCGGIWIDGSVQAFRDLRDRGAVFRWQMPAFGLLAVVIFAASVFLGTRFPPPAVRWDHVVWGYIKMGKPQAARALAEQVVLEQPDNEPVLEALGYLAAAGQKYDEAVQDFQRAVALRPRSYVAHFNLAKAFLAVGDRAKAAEEATLALSLNPTTETQALLEEIQAAP
jgi:4-amino-4-deoxy-L-arabinose transferase-like glycosyltransferase